MASDVRLEHLTKHYGDIRAITDVSLHVDAGEFVSVLGASGAGKSTILRLIGGFEFPDSGNIRIGGKDITDLPPYRRDVNTVFQSYALFPHMTVAENVAYGLRQDRVPRAELTTRVRDALDMVQLRPLAYRKPSQISGGQQQRIALARALVKRPSVLLLDEPLGALDRKLRQEMQVELKLLQDKLELTFVFVTHDQDEALAMSNRIAVMRDGRITQIGTPAELYDQPRTAYVAGFIGSQNFFAGSIENVMGSLTTDDGHALFAQRCADGVTAGGRGLAAVRPENIKLLRNEPATQGNKIQATIIAISMLGDALEFVLRAATGEEYFARLPRNAETRLSQGDLIWMNWSTEHMALFPFEQLSTNAYGRAQEAGTGPDDE